MYFCLDDGSPLETDSVATVIRPTTSRPAVRTFFDDQGNYYGPKFVEIETLRLFPEFRALEESNGDAYVRFWQSVLINDVWTAKHALVRLLRRCAEDFVDGKPLAPHAEIIRRGMYAPTTSEAIDILAVAGLWIPQI